MLNQRLKAAKQVATKLRALEEAIDDALICAAELVAETPKARREANLSAVVGQDAIALTGEAMAAIHTARAKMIEAHACYADVRDQVGLTPRMTGDLWKLVDETRSDPVTALHVVA